jgi:hypothetical protein
MFLQDLASKWEIPSKSKVFMRVRSFLYVCTDGLSRVGLIQAAVRLGDDAVRLDSRGGPAFLCAAVVLLVKRRA